MKIIYSIGTKFAGGGIGNIAYQDVRAIAGQGMLHRLLCGAAAPNYNTRQTYALNALENQRIMSTATDLKVSVVIPTYNRRELLRRCLAAATHQDYADYEVIVVDDGSTDGTDAMVAQTFPRVHYVRQANRGPAAARNRGIDLANGTIVAFTDDDCEPPGDWLHQLVALFEQYPGVVAVGGVVEAPARVRQHTLLARYEYAPTPSASYARYYHT